MYKRQGEKLVVSKMPFRVAADGSVELDHNELGHGIYAVSYTHLDVYKRQALIAYIWYEAPEEEQNFSMLIDLVDASEAREDDENFKNAVDLLFNELVLSGKLFEHCAEIDEAARNRMELIVPELAKQYGVTGQLKAENLSLLHI